MTVCKFWRQGNCRNGDACRFEHPGASRQSQSQNQGQNRFQPFNNDQRSAGRGGGPFSNPPQHAAQDKTPYGLNTAMITTDLTSERPIWILSAYGPGRNAPVQLFGGFPREQSFEELRLKQHKFTQQGLQQQGLQEAHALFATAEDQNKQAVRNPENAIKYIIDGENQHPNRVDVCRSAGEILETQEAAQARGPPPGSFGGPPAPAINPFQSQSHLSKNAQVRQHDAQARGPPPGSFGGPPAPAINPFQSQSHLSKNAQVRQHDTTGKLVSWKGRSVKDVDGVTCFKRDDGNWERIVFPDPPQWRKPEEVQPGEYDATVKGQYDHMKMHGNFKDGIVPDMAPKREWISWDI